MKRNLFFYLTLACIITFLSIQKNWAQLIPADFYKPKVDFITGTIPSSGAIRHVDGDGKPDLVVTN